MVNLAFLEATSKWSKMNRHELRSSLGATDNTLRGRCRGYTIPRAVQMQGLEKASESWLSLCTWQGNGCNSPGQSQPHQ